ncbi:hypothetical protein ACFXPW_34595 [Streptomyces goshikiensis]|uniref:hypothetical protein n=1 Tax=Streptomyces goshikiensis TaxID=1942 RepID=UPI00368DE951
MTDKDELILPALFLRYGEAMYYAVLLEKMLHAFDAERRFEMIEQGQILSAGGWGGSDNMSDNIKKVARHDANLGVELKDAVASRNHLAHDFWLVNGTNVYSRDKAKVVNDDLDARTKVFRGLTRRILVLMVEIGRQKGRMPMDGNFERNLQIILSDLDG